MTATSAILTQDQINQLTTAYNAAVGQEQHQQGVWASTYELLYGFLTTQTLGVDAPRVGVDPQTWLWLKGARFVNAGDGLFATLIRDYTKAQFKQRYGKDLSDAQANLASNRIAQNFIGQWLGFNPANGNLATQPTITETGVFDAGAAASTVFGLANKTSDGDNAAGWAGALLFPNLGAPDFFRYLILDGLTTPATPAHYQNLTSVDVGSYDLIAVAAALETFASTHWPGGLRADQFAAFLRQLLNLGSVAGLAAEADEEFLKYYDLGHNDPTPAVGSDVLGVFCVNIVTNIFKSSNYYVGTKYDDIITINPSLLDELGSIAVTGNTNIINTGRGDDFIYAGGSWDKYNSDIVDGGVGNDTVSYLNSSAVTVKFYQRNSMATFDAEVVKGSLLGATIAHDLLYNVEQITGSPNADNFSGDTSKLPDGFVIDAGAGNDNISIKGGTHIITAGGLGRDFIYNASSGGEIWGDVAKSYLNIDENDPNYDKRFYVTTSVDAQGVSHVDRNYIADSAANSDEIQWSSNTVLEDAQRNDVLEFFGIPLVGGDDSGGIVLGLAGASSGFTSAGVAGTKAQQYLSELNTTYVDSLQPYIFYRFVQGDNGQYDLVVGNELTGFLSAVASIVDSFSSVGGTIIRGLSHLLPKYTGTMLIKDFVNAKQAASGGFPVTYRGIDQFALTGLSKLNLVFKKENPIFEILAHLPPTLITFAASGGGPLVDAAETAAAAAVRFAKGLGWATAADPLVLDLTGNGLETTPLNGSSVHFDLNNDYFSERTGWLTGNAGFLVLDKNGNGLIDDASEMFGVASGTGFGDLSAYDSNHDGVITADDAVFAKLQVWVDANGDGVTDPGELHSLADLGITSISLNSTALDGQTADGATLSAVSSFTRSDGTTGGIYEGERARASGGRARAVASAWRNAPFHFASARNKRCPTYNHIGYSVCHENDSHTPLARFRQRLDSPPPHQAWCGGRGNRLSRSSIPPRAANEAASEQWGIAA